MGGKRITYKEQRIIEDLLHSRLTIIGEGLCKYNGSGSDEHVVAEARMKGVGDCTKFHVRHIRKAMFGELRGAPAEPVYAVPGVILDQLRGFEANIHAIQALHDSIMERLDRQRADLNTVMDYLTRTEGVDWQREQHRFGLKKAG